MAVTKQLHQLQEIDQEIEATGQALKEKESQLGDRQVLDRAQQHLQALQEQRDGLKRQHREAEGAVDDVMSKIAGAEEQLYSGRITNPKELSNLQHEVSTLKTRNDELENEALAIIDQVEAAEKSCAAAAGELKTTEEAWQRLQVRLAAGIEQDKSRLAELDRRRRQLAGETGAEALALYERIRQQKSPAVARAEQGVCRVCHISLSAAELQRVRGGNPVLCGSCGRILFMP